MTEPRCCLHDLFCCLMTIIFCLAAPEDSVVHDGKPQQFAACAKSQESVAASGISVNLTSSDSDANAARWERILGNDVENIPLAIAVAGIATLGFCGSNNCFHASAHAVTITIFAVGRVLHTIFYANAIQPLRTLVFALSQFFMVFLAINAVIAELSKPK